MDFRTPWPTIRPTIRKTASRLRSTWSWAPPPDSTRTGQSDARGFTDVRASGGDPKKRQKFSLYPAFVPADRLPPGRDVPPRVRIRAENGLGMMGISSTRPPVVGRRHALAEL